MFIFFCVKKSKIEKERTNGDDWVSHQTLRPKVYYMGTLIDRVSLVERSFLALEQNAFVFTQRLSGFFFKVFVTGAKKPNIGERY